MKLLRDTLKRDALCLQASITAYQRMIDFYEELVTKQPDGERWAYLDERLNYLYGIMAEHQVAQLDMSEELRG